MTIVVLGGTGFIGSAVVQRLSARNPADVVAISRGKRQPPPEGIRHEVADRRDSGALAAILSRHAPTALIDILPMTMSDAQPVLDAAAASGARYVMISSCDVYANYGGLVKLESPPPLALLDEDAPLRSRLYPYRKPEDKTPDADSYDKIPIERAAAADPRLRATILRLPMVYGPGDGQHRFRWMVEAIRNGGPIALDERYARWRSTFGFITDVAEAIALAATDDRAAGRTYNLGEAPPVPTIVWLARIALAIGRDIDVTRVPPDQRGAGADMAEGADLAYDLAISTARIRTELAFAEPTPPAEAMRQTVDWEAASLD